MTETGSYPRNVKTDAGEIEFRLMSRTDAAAMLEFGQKLPTHDLLFLPRNISQPKVLSAWIDEIGRGDITSLLAIKDGKVVGCSTGELVARDVPNTVACGLGFSTGRLRCLTWSYSSVTEDDHHARLVVCFPVFPVADFEGGDHPSPLARRRRSGSHAKNDVHDAFDFTETLRVEVEGDFDVFVVLPDDLEGEACGCELNEPQAVVAGVGIVIEGLDVADAAIIILELTLNEKIGLIGGRQIQVIVAGVLVIERGLEVLAAGLSDGHMFGVESHWRGPCFSALPSSVSRPRLPEGPPQGNGFARIA